MSTSARTPLWAVLVFACALMTGCTGQDIYESGTSFRVQECERIPDAGKRDECLALARMSYKDYQQMTKESAR